MKVEFQRNVGFGTWLYLRLGRLWLTWGAYQGNWYFQIMWA